MSSLLNAYRMEFPPGFFQEVSINSLKLLGLNENSTISYTPLNHPNTKVGSTVREVCNDIANDTRNTTFSPGIVYEHEIIPGLPNTSTETPMTKICEAFVKLVEPSPPVLDTDTPVDLPRPGVDFIRHLESRPGKTPFSDLVWIQISPPGPNINATTMFKEKCKALTNEDANRAFILFDGYDPSDHKASPGIKTRVTMQELCDSLEGPVEHSVPIPEPVSSSRVLNSECTPLSTANATLPYSDCNTFLHESDIHIMFQLSGALLVVFLYLVSKFTSKKEMNERALAKKQEVEIGKLKKKLEAKDNEIFDIEMELRERAELRERRKNDADQLYYKCEDTKDDLAKVKKELVETENEAVSLREKLRVAEQRISNTAVETQTWRDFSDDLRQAIYKRESSIEELGVKLRVAERKVSDSAMELRASRNISGNLWKEIDIREFKIQGIQDKLEDAEKRIGDMEEELKFGNEVCENLRKEIAKRDFKIEVFGAMLEDAKKESAEAKKEAAQLKLTMQELAEVEKEKAYVYKPLGCTRISATEESLKDDAASLSYVDFEVVKVADFDVLEQNTTEATERAAKKHAVLLTESDGESEEWSDMGDN